MKMDTIMNSLISFPHCQADAHRGQAGGTIATV